MKLTNKGKSLLYRIFAFLVYAVPMAALFIINHDAYDTEASAVGFWGFVILAFVLMAFKGAFLKLFHKRALTTVSLVLFVFAVLFQSLAEEMLLITGVSAAASVVSSLVEVVADVYAKHAYKMEDGEKVMNKEPAIPDKEAWREAYGYNFIAVEKNDKNE